MFNHLMNINIERYSQDKDQANKIALIQEECSDTIVDVDLDRFSSGMESFIIDQIVDKD